VEFTACTLFHKALICCILATSRMTVWRTIFSKNISKIIRLAEFVNIFLKCARACAKRVYCIRIYYTPRPITITLVLRYRLVFRANVWTTIMGAGKIMNAKHRVNIITQPLIITGKRYDGHAKQCRACN